MADFGEKTRVRGDKSGRAGRPQLGITQVRAALAWPVVRTISGARGDIRQPRSGRGKSIFEAILRVDPARAPRC